MLNPISSYPVSQKPIAPALSSLPIEVREEIESHLDWAAKKAFFEALTIATRDGDPLDSPALKLHLLQQRIAPKYRQSLASSDKNLQAFALNQLQRLYESGQLDQIVERPAFFELVRLINDPEIFEFLREKVQQEPELKQKLLSWVERSKTEEVQATAANALTLLVKAGIPLSGKDFSRIRVPGADLSYGVFAHTKFQNADLRWIDWAYAWLGGTNLDGADLAGLQLREKPCLEMNKEISACCYSPDRRWIAIAEDNQIQLYETENLTKLHTYIGHEKEVLSVAFSSDGQWLASGSNDGMKLWHVLGNRSLAHTYVDRSRVCSVAFSSDGQWLAESCDIKVRLWRVSGDYSLAHTYTKHDGVVNSIAFSGDGQWLAAGSYKTVKLWRVSGDRSLAHTYDAQGTYIKSVTFSSDGQWLASENNQYDKGEIKLWNVSGDRSLEHTYKHFGAVNSVAFSGDGQWLASGGNNKLVKLWHVSGNRSLAQTYVGHTDKVINVSFSGDGQWLASGSTDKTVRQWFVSEDHRSFKKYLKDTSVISAFSNDGQWLAAEYGDSVKLLHVADNSTLTNTYSRSYYTGEEGASSIAFSADGQWLAAGTPDGIVKLWNISENGSSKIFYCREDGCWVNGVAISSDGQWLAYNEEDTVKLQHASGDASLSHSYAEGEDDNVTRVAFSNDNQWLASGTSNGKVKLWNVSGDQSLEYTYNGHDDEVYSVVFSSDGRWLASGGDDKKVNLWNVSGDRSLAYIYTGHKNAIESIAFSSNSQWLASGSYDETVRIWSVLTGDCQAVLQSFIGPIGAVTWQRTQDDAAILCANGENSTLCFWRVLFNSDQISTIVLDGISGQDTTLTATGALIENARNLSPQNAALLRQRGAKKAQISESYS